MGVCGTNNTVEGFGVVIRPSTQRAKATETTTKQAQDRKETYQHARNGGEQRREGAREGPVCNIPGPVLASRFPQSSAFKERRLPSPTRSNGGPASHGWGRIDPPQRSRYKTFV